MKNKKHWSEDFDKICCPSLITFSVLSVSLYLGLFIPHIIAKGANVPEVCFVAIVGVVCCLMSSVIFSGIFASMVCNVGNFFHKNKLRKEKNKENKSIEFENWVRGCRIRKDKK